MCSSDLFSTPSPSPAARPASPAGAGSSSWQRQEPGFQKREGAVYQQLLHTPARSEEPLSAPPPVPQDKDPPLTANTHSFGRVLTVVQEQYALLEGRKGLVLLALAVAERWLKQAQLEPGSEGLKPQPLLIPVRLKLDKAEREAGNRSMALLNQMGIDLQFDAHHVMLRAVPLPLRQQNLQNLIPEMLGYLSRHQEVTACQTAQWLARQSASEHQHWNHSQAITLLAEVERLCPQLVKSPPSGLLQYIDIEMAMTALKHE